MPLVQQFIRLQEELSFVASMPETLNRLPGKSARFALIIMSLSMPIMTVIQTERGSNSTSIVRDKKGVVLMPEANE